jgi:polycomb protein EED
MTKVDKQRRCEPCCSWREWHRKPIYAVAFNEADASQADVFAIVGSNWVSVYRLPAAPPSSAFSDAADAAEDKSRKRKSRPIAAMPPRLDPLQTYADDDPDEIFYSVAWGRDASSGHAWLAAAGKQRQIRLIDCHRGSATRTMQGHGGAVHEVRFAAHEGATLLLSASEDESVRLWCCATAYCLAIFAGQQGHRDAVLSVDVRCAFWGARI